jgi:hypothetical protein
MIANADIILPIGFQDIALFGVDQQSSAEIIDTTRKERKRKLSTGKKKDLVNTRDELELKRQYFSRISQLFVKISFRLLIEEIEITRFVLEETVFTTKTKEKYCLLAPV